MPCVGFLLDAWLCYSAVHGFTGTTRSSIQRSGNKKGDFNTVISVNLWRTKVFIWITKCLWIVMMKGICKTKLTVSVVQTNVDTSYYVLMYFKLLDRCIYIYIYILVNAQITWKNKSCRLLIQEAIFGNTSRERGRNITMLTVSTSQVNNKTETTKQFDLMDNYLPVWFYKWANVNTNTVNNWLGIAFKMLQLQFFVSMSHLTLGTVWYFKLIYFTFFVVMCVCFSSAVSWFQFNNGWFNNLMMHH